MGARRGIHRYIERYSQDINDSNVLEESLKRYPGKKEIVENIIRRRSGYILRLPKLRRRLTK